MTGLLLLASIGTDAPGQDWESVWRQNGRKFTLVGITHEEEFLNRSQQLIDLLQGLIGQFRRTEVLPSKVLKVVGEVIEQVDVHFLGMAAWQQDLPLPEKVRHLGTLSAAEKVQRCLSRLRTLLRAMRLTVEGAENKRDLLVQHPETALRLSEWQEESLEQLSELVIHIEEMRNELGKYQEYYLL